MQYAKVKTIWDDNQANMLIGEGWEVVGYEPAGEDQDNEGYRMGLPWRVMAAKLRSVIEEFDRCGLISVFKAMKQLDPEIDEFIPDEHMQIVLDYIERSKGPHNLEAIKAAIADLEAHGEREYMLGE